MDNYIRNLKSLQLQHKGKETEMYAKYAELRDAKGYRDSDVAKAAGISQATLTEWKKGTYQPKAEKLIKIADFFGVTLDELVRSKV